MTEVNRRRAVSVLVRGEADQDLDAVGGREAVVDEDLDAQRPAGSNDVRVLKLRGGPTATQDGAEGKMCPVEAESLRLWFWIQVLMERLWRLPG